MEDKITTSFINLVSGRVQRMMNAALDAFDGPKISDSYELRAAFTEAVLFAARNDMTHPRTPLRVHQAVAYDLGYTIHTPSGPINGRIPLSHNEDMLGPIPMKLRYNNQDVVMHVEDCPKILQEWAKVRRDVIERRALVRDQHLKVSDHIIYFLRNRNGKSIAEAIRDLPELELYIPRGYTEGRSIPAGPRRRLRYDDLYIDRELLASVGIAYRITQT